MHVKPTAEAASQLQILGCGSASSGAVAFHQVSTRTGSEAALRSAGEEVTDVANALGLGTPSAPQSHMMR